MSTLIYTVDGNQGKILEVYSDRCVIVSQRTQLGTEFPFSEIAGIKFRNLTFFMSGYIKFECKESSRGMRSGENCFIFNAPSGGMREKLIAQMPAVYEFISEKVKEAGGMCVLYDGK